MKTKNINVLPKTAAEIVNGGLYQQAVRCGKPSCRCASGDLHHGYYYFIRRFNGRLKKTYIPKGQVDQVGLLVEQARRDRQTEREQRLTDRALLAGLREKLREYEPMIRALEDALNQNG